MTLENRESPLSMGILESSKIKYTVLLGLAMVFCAAARAKRGHAAQTPGHSEGPFSSPSRNEWVFPPYFHPTSESTCAVWMLLNMFRDTLG